MIGKDNCIGFYTEEICDEFDRIGLTKAIVEAEACFYNSFFNVYTN